MRKGGVVVLGATDCMPGDDDRYNKWFNEVHIPMLMKFKGLKSVWRGKVLDRSDDQPKYVVAYQFESQRDYEDYQKSAERQSALEEMEQSKKNMPFEVKWRLPLEVFKVWEK
ncbi:MAG: DUF4286 family protein [Dehalococcoidales bacterium]|nr:DUF4286 family protein [Dehalococcoidales bacterium]